jgi:hypothetical protein
MYKIEKRAQKMKKYSLYFIMISLFIFLTSCNNIANSKTSSNGTLIQIQNPFAPQEGDSEMNKEKAYVESTSWDEKTETLTISGELPSPCNQLRINISLASEEINLEVYSLLPKDSICSQVLEPFEANLVFKNYSNEKYPVSINGEKILSRLRRNKP